MHRSCFYIEAISSTPSAAHNLHLQTTTQERGIHFYLKPKTEKCVCVFAILCPGSSYISVRAIGASYRTNPTVDKISLFCFINDAKFGCFLVLIPFCVALWVLFSTFSIFVLRHLVVIITPDHNTEKLP